MPFDVININFWIFYIKRQWNFPGFLIADHSRLMITVTLIPFRIETFHNSIELIVVLINEDICDWKKVV